VKTGVQQNVPGLAFIKLLNPVTYHLQVNAINSLTLSEHQKKIGMDKDEKSILEKESKLYTGFIAQEVEAAAKQAGYDFSGVDAPKNEKDLYGLRYSEFVVPLVKSVQELAAQNAELKSDLEILKQELSQLKEALKEVKEAKK
jgi:hypothetical protein